MEFFYSILLFSVFVVLYIQWKDISKFIGLFEEL